MILQPFISTHTLLNPRNWFRPRHNLYFSTNVDPKSYSKTLLLPKTSLPSWIDPSKGEEPFRKRTTEQLYQWQVSGKNPGHYNINTHFFSSGKIIQDGFLSCMTAHLTLMVTYTWVRMYVCEYSCIYKEPQVML